MTSGEWARVGELFHELAELDAREQERRLSVLEATDARIAEEVRSLLAADRQSHLMPDRAELAPDDSPLVAGASVGPYRVLAELGRGGMGIVYRGERADGAFERQVAIKVALPDLVSPALGARFAAERQILASLDHPGIAGLLDAGTTVDGRLYLVLDLVEGVRIDLWAQGKPLRERLELFVAVCEAVDHAHRRLVLHRDLKPANILVNAGGEAKLLDFGIARLLGDDGSPGEATRLGFRLLTPEYASPEQLRGEPLSTATDVYSLGVVLFELLTGERPHAVSKTTSPEERARRIATDPLPRPSAVLRQASRRSLGTEVAASAVEGDLDAILSQALAPDPAERYSSVAAFVDDLRRHLAGRPVEARSPGFVERARKFVLRHRLAVAVAAAFVLVLLGATAFSLRQAANAASERDLALRRFADLRELARVFLFELPDRIERLPGSTGARELLVKTGLSYLDRLRAEAGGDAEFLAELASGYERLGQVQGGFHAPNIGETAAALATFDRAIELREGLAAGPQPSFVSRSNLAAAYLLRASALFKSGRMKEALAEARRATDLVAADAPYRPDPGVEAAEADRLRARGLTLRGFLEAVGGDVTSAERSLRAAIARFEAIGAASSTDQRLRREWAHAQEGLGTVLGQSTDRLEEVDQLWIGALAVNRALVAEDPRHPEWRSAVLGSLGMLAILRGIQGRLEEALVFSGEALDLAERLAGEDPEDFDAQRRVASLHNRRAADLAETGRFAEAEKSARVGLAGVERLFALDPTNVTVESLLAEGHAAVAESLAARAKATSDLAAWRAARGEFTTAVDIVERLIARGVLANQLGEAREAEAMRARIAECDTALAISQTSR
jgi:eukaryotic-like serine/threonine-protein kinase